MTVALLALLAALGGTAYAAGRINGNLIDKQSIGGGKLKQKTLTSYRINTNKLGTVPSSKRAIDTLWAVVDNPPGPGNATLARASDSTISVVEAGNAVDVIYPGNVAVCSTVAGRDNSSTAVPKAGYAQTNTSAANPDAIEVHTRNANGDNEDGDFQLITVCP